MGSNKHDDKDRRWFLSMLLAGKMNNAATDDQQKPEMVKMLTADGKLVEVEKSVLDAMTTGQKATNRDIYDWMKNPSKDKNG